MPEGVADRLLRDPQEVRGGPGVVDLRRPLALEGALRTRALGRPRRQLLQRRAQPLGVHLDRHQPPGEVADLLVYRPERPAIRAATVRIVAVNGTDAKFQRVQTGLVDWEVEVNVPADGALTARATDQAGNAESPGHCLRVK